MNTQNVQPATALVLRCSASDMTSRDGFVWPGVGGIATAPDWRDDLECGGGLHGWLYGAGDYTASDYWRETDAKWLVLEVAESGIRQLDRKCKFPSALVRFVGGKAAAAAYLVAHEPRAVACDVIGLSVVAGDHQTAASGPLGTATAGDSGTATAGYKGTATSGNWGTATSGDWGAATAGESGTATAGDSGTATAGYSGTAIAGDGGTATAGDNGEIRIRYYDSKANRYRTAVGYAGENGIEADVAYKLDADHKFIKV